MEILLGLGQGLHNAPRLYGDTTVRRAHRVTGLASGFSAAFSEFTLGTYDAITGVVTQPYYGVKNDGAVGLVTGIGKGLGGLVLKESAAVITPIGYMMKGVQKQLTKKRTPIATIRAERVRQGKLDLASLDGADYNEALKKVQHAWQLVETLVQKGEQMKKESGTIRGTFKLRREKKAWAKYGVLENTEMGREALEAREKGIPFEKFMEGRQRRMEEEDNAARRSSVIGADEIGGSSEETD